MPGPQAEAAEAAGKTIILINPQLVDLPSSGGVMGVKGRKERLEFGRTFYPAYHLRLLYIGKRLILYTFAHGGTLCLIHFYFIFFAWTGAAMYPIMGALRFAHGGAWEVWQRVDIAKKVEAFKLIAEFPEEPLGDKITAAFTRANKDS